MTGSGMGSCNSMWFIIALAADVDSRKTPLLRFPTGSEFVSTSLFKESFPWGTSIWACLLYSGVVLLFAYLIHRLRVRQIEAQLTTLFHSRLAERASITRDRNDSLLQTIEASKLIADDALDPSTDMARMREAMERLSNWLGQATGEGQAALNSLGIAGYDGNDLTSSFGRVAEECLSHRSTEFALLVTGAHRDMHPLVRDEVYRLGCEVIRNTCLRRDIGRVDIELTYGWTFCLRVRSSDRSLGSPVTKTGEGEHLDIDQMRRRAERFGASFDVTASSGSVVELTLTVPGGVIFQNASSVLPRWLTHLWHRLFRSGKGIAS